MDFSVYDDYALVYADNLVAKDITDGTVPRAGVRLDDKLEAMALTCMKHHELHEYWPAEFDRNGVPRATRVPLGRACKVKVERGDVDADRNVCTDPGWYYA